MRRTLSNLALIGLALVGWRAIARAEPPQVLWAGPGQADAEVLGELAPPAPGRSTPTTQPGLTRRLNPLPGVTLDRKRRRVMVECTSLRPGGPLELVACAPNTREHEAVVTVNARPQHIHLALLLCGFEPGHPAGWDEKNEKPILATGDPVDLQIRWTDPKTGKVRVAPIEDWLAPSDPAKPMPRLSWLFTGSRRFEDGQYWADLEGSVVSISNFPDAVIDLSGAHSRDDAVLEFKGNEKVMPPMVRNKDGDRVGVPCVLILLPPAVLRVELDRFGKISVEGQPVQPARLPRILATHRRSRDDARVRLLISPDAVKADADRLLAQCAQAGFGRDRIDRGVPATQPGAFAFPTNDPRAAIDLLTGQWREHRQTVARNVAAQRQWFEQLEDRRQLLTRQYRELTDYILRAREQYSRSLADLWAGQ